MDKARKRFITSYMEDIAYTMNLEIPMKHVHGNTGDDELTK